LVGDTITLATLENDTRPMLNSSGSSATNCLAAVWAATIRLGVTSSACIDSDTSRAIMTVARSSGTRVSTDGLARASARMNNASSRATAGACLRSGPIPLGATDRSRSTLENRTAIDRRRRCRSR
jgi:hypothetical protein